jgi:hypothetical protein
LEVDMGQLSRIIDNMELKSSVELEPYTFSINDEAVKYDTRTSNCEIDTDGDLMLNFMVDSGDLLDIIEDEDIITYLENNGYEVKSED